MNSHYTYLLIDAGTLLFPLLFSFDKRVAFYKSWPALLPAMFATAAVFIVWDIAFTAKGIWWFSRNYTLSWRLGGLPVEEWLFFLFIPYSCVFIHACLKLYFGLGRGKGGWKWFMAIGAVLSLFAALNNSRAYSLSSFGGCGFGLLLAFFMRRKVPMFNPTQFLVAYSIALLPFLIVNGLLTSLPIVLYDDAENTGIRIGTIPIEDVFYGMLLVLGNVWGMYFWKQWRSKKV